MKDMLPAAAAAFGVGAVALALRPGSDGAAANLAFLVLVTFAALLVSGLAANEPRAWIMLQVSRIGVLRDGS
jgi:hypothetical protein